MSLPFPNIDPVALSIGPIDIRWYALAYLAGFLLGWKYALYLTGLSANNRPNRDDIDNFIPFTVLGVILGGRLGYVLFYQFETYLSDPLSIFMVWQGGMSFHGGVLGVITAIIGYGLYQKIHLLRLSDIVCAVVPIGLFLGRIANFINGELFGRVTDKPWGFVFPYGGPEPRHPSQLYEAFLEGLLLLGILAVLIHKPLVRVRPGIVTGVFLMGYALSRFIVEFAREPDAHLGFIIGQVSMGQLLSLPMFLFGAAVMTYSLSKGRQVA
ncbi:MAG: prolipoprotein diacylglyceryl transferase [Alphaproteobacteria bacterium]|nr:prolipoprotein diacylglyceryl transferase [Alphaproteobacteria bacterium]